MEGNPGMVALTVQGAMQTPGSGIGRVGPVHRLRIVGIDQNQVRGLDAREVGLIGIHQKLRAIVIHGHREMICHTLVHIESCGPTKRSGKV